MALERSKEIARSFGRELLVYQRVLQDERTPLSAKLFLALDIGYLCMPFDLIPDFIPIIGHLDDAIASPSKGQEIDFSAFDYTIDLNFSRPYFFVTGAGC